MKTKGAVAIFMLESFHFFAGAAFAMQMVSIRFAVGLMFEKRFSAAR